MSESQFDFILDNIAKIWENALSGKYSAGAVSPQEMFDLFGAKPGDAVFKMDCPNGHAYPVLYARDINKSDKEKIEKEFFKGPKKRYKRGKLT